ncbi:hypothetical protein [Paenibacillus rhizophilus]|uniref:Uncharacterized protein n=1 Tax=Paenibacillus rhizophilus TaxID=1850366 RepID=A0A3N9PB71_9BACL|nr:hypothetical protein [Paenibacillus rhizophilus]RQW13498.1 hypothetical protein EH198_03500 [Paenibacillus rhizophilus]
MMDMDMSGSVQGSVDMGTYGGTGSVISGILSTVTQLLLVALIISLIVGIAVWLKNAYFKESYNKGKQVISNDPMLKTIFILAATFVGVIIVLYLLGILMNGGFNPNRMGIVSSWSVSGILTFFVKLLTILFVVALIASLYSYVKQNINKTPVASSNGAVLAAGNELKSNPIEEKPHTDKTSPDEPETNKD